MKSIRIIYWIATSLVALSLLMAGFMYFSGAPEIKTNMAHLGYPFYFLYILGTAKILGALVLLIPGMPRLKEWAYAGVTFTMIGAFWSHSVIDSPATAIAPLVVLALLLTSYYTYHKLNSSTNIQNETFRTT